MLFLFLLLLTSFSNAMHYQSTFTTNAANNSASYNQIQSHSFAVEDHSDPLNCKLKNIQRTMQFYSYPTAIDKLNDIVHANESRRLINICPLSAIELAKNDIIQYLLSIPLQFINNKIATCALREMNTTEGIVNIILKRIPQEFQDIILYKLRQYWSDTHLPIFCSYPSFLDLSKNIHFDSVHEIILFDQLIKVTESHDFNALTEINKLGSVNEI
jgi:hypothetical protein